MTRLDTPLTSRDRSRVAEERLTADPAQSWRLLRVDAPIQVPWHRHEEWELVHVRRGRVVAGIGQHVVPLGRGDLALVDGSRPHAFEVDHDGSATAPDLTVAVFATDFLGAALWERPEFVGARRLLDAAPLVLHDDAERCPDVRDALDAMSSSPARMRTTRLLDVLVALAASTGWRRLDAGAGTHEVDPRMTAALAYLHESFREPLALPVLAQRVGLSPATLSRSFHRTYGRTLTDELHRVRVAEACRLLVTTDEPVSRISGEVGFGTIAQFNRIFRRARGTTPTEFRREARRLGAVPDER
jgi:AraC-like DNA-binding protein